MTPCGHSRAFAGLLSAAARDLAGKELLKNRTWQRIYPQIPAYTRNPWKDRRAVRSGFGSNTRHARGIPQAHARAIWGAELHASRAGAGSSLRGHEIGTLAA